MRAVIALLTLMVVAGAIAAAAPTELTPVDRATATCVRAQAEGRLIYPLARCIRAELLNPEDD